MLCEVCKKNQAKIHVTQIKNNTKHSIHICQECAHEKGIAGPTINTSFSVEQLLSGKSVSTEGGATGAKTHQTCPTCGLSYGAFTESGRLGCAECYETFAEFLRPLLHKVQKELKHKGKIPRQGDALLSMKREISTLRLRLKEAVGIENFEEAAHLRDRIRNLEEELTDAEHPSPDRNQTL